MRQSVSKLMARFGNVGIKQERVDRSSCEVSRASAFGDKTQYFCNAYYTLSYPITNQNDIDRLVNVITNTVNQSTDIIYGIDDNSTGEIKLSDIKAENTFYTATNFMLKSVKTVRGGCYIRYLVSQNQDFVDVGVECTANTKKAYFEPIEYK